MKLLILPQIMKLILLVHSDILVHFLDQKYPYYNAKRECNKSDPNAFLPTDDLNKTMVINSMKTKGINAFWIAAERKQLKDWKWVDDSTFCPPSFNSKDVAKFDKDPIHRCALFDVKEDNIKPCFCYASRKCYICRLPACDHSKNGYYKCIPRSGHVIAIGHSLDNWFEARKHCQRSGGDLAKLDTNQKKRYIIEDTFSQTQVLATLCTGLYVGLRLEDWIYTDSQCRGERSVNASAWDDGQPSNHNCAELVLTKGNDLKLRAKDCLQTSHVLCIQKGGERSLKTATGGPKKETPHTAGAVYGSLGALVFLIIMTALAVWRCCKRRRQSGEANINGQSEDNNNRGQPSQTTQYCCLRETRRRQSGETNNNGHRETNNNREEDTVEDNLLRQPSVVA